MGECEHLHFDLVAFNKFFDDLITKNPVFMQRVKEGKVRFKEAVAVGFEIGYDVGYVRCLQDKGVQCDFQ